MPHDPPFVVEPSGFNGRLIRWNGLDAAGFAAWEFLPGMRFNECAAWWRDGAGRGSAHEGLDILWYRTGDGRRLSLPPGSRVPAVYPGEVVSVVDDFLGVSVFVAHERVDGRGRRLHSIFGHIRPRPGLTLGSRVAAGDAVGTVADTSGGRSRVPAHLHLSLALVRGARGPERLDWQALRDSERARLLDPMILMTE